MRAPSIAVASAFVLASSMARADDPPAPSTPSRAETRFGSAAVFVVTSDQSIGIAKTTFENSDAEGFRVYASPGLDWFVIDHLSIGIDLSAGYGESRGYSAEGGLVRNETTSFSGGPRVGADLPLGRYVSFYPRLTLGIETIRREDSVVVNQFGAQPANAVGIPSTARDGPWVYLFAPLLLHPAPHFFIGAGPTFFHAFARVRGGPDVGGERTSVGGHLLFGTWWGGGSDEPAAEGASTSHAPAFGESGQVVFSGEFGIGGAKTWYAGTGTSTEALSIAPGVDYFVARHVSVGIAFDYGSSKTTGLRPDGIRTTTKAAGGGGSLRLGVDIPFTSWLSFYPRGGFRFGTRVVDTRAGTEGYGYDEGLTTATLFAPLLVHPASHAFIGIGPYVAYDLVRQIKGTDASTPATSVGADLIVGGWL